jgi:O-antigen ligase
MEAATAIATTPSVGRREPQRDAGEQPITRAQITAVVAFVVLHIPLAMIMKRFPIVSTAHAAAVLGIGLFFASTTKKIRYISMIVAYTTGCEVLWRMTKSATFWEFGKYAAVVILIVAIIRMQAARNRGLAIAYFALLIPSVALTFTALPFGQAREEVSFNLSGPLALAAAVLFFSNIKLTANQLRVTFFSLIAPVVGIAALSFVSTRASRDIAFVNASNLATSGGFGSNQVASMLGLAVMFLVLMSLDRRLEWKLRIPMMPLAAALAAQAALTFSRGGIALAFAGICAAVIFLFQVSMRRRITIAVVMGTLYLVGVYVVEPQLDAFTGGKLSQRYSNRKSSGRDQFLAAEVEMFQESPVLGVGPGMGMWLRSDRGLIYGASHTEYTRVLAEHGIFGILSLGCLVALGIRAMRRSKDLAVRAHAAAMLVWVGLFLAVYGTRIAAPAFVFGLASVSQQLASRKSGKS